MNKKLAVVILLLTTIAGIAIVYGLITSQSPVVHRTGVVTSANCAVWNVASEQPGSASGYVVPTGPGDVLFNCSGITGTITASKVGQATPTFTLPTGFAVITVIPHVLNPTSTSCTLPSVGLGSGTPFTFTSPGDYDYCAAYDSSTGDLGSFSLSWA